MEGLILFLGLFTWSNSDYFETVAVQQADGYRWEQIECRAPEADLPSLTINTPIGNSYVCYKLVR